MASTPNGWIMAPEEDNDTGNSSSSSSSLKFGTPEALEHVRKLTDVGAMTRLLHECIAYQRAIDLELENVLSQRTDLDKQLSNLQKSAEVLEIVKADSDYMLYNVHSACDLADQISGKVRELDLAQSRVNETPLRIDAIVERGNCIDGVKKALETEDFESAAKYVQTFLQIDAKYKDSGLRSGGGGGLRLRSGGGYGGGGGYNCSGGGGRYGGGGGFGGGGGYGGGRDSGYVLR
ncbi:hypothetical protein F0562_032689 [Nyssa sinensis]|uniref:Conserved oligomeric Golgi complex subunit 4 N-terminal domain-containing protein n=1 Tax=Nyssa sinensis TaxID=561372 RepID=A0A5J5AS17_9ASTE|nr:hypothetical protein F0562_032689 [Nyssa sinensis]